ncbi:peptidoglycan DD-metalloendopeptidase family protein [Homoserinibacter sp. GY 40078]|uniref:peptidoglycan DD-metalloendopeptidase family protein n=1 Tax=Homoserinibacter sp. GY 40078 TaxID=2603275 RepID=UPI0011CC827B|nr:peptidoglycan DD-metalloendopeptidase family protein [Homoserinibacter sp. GY 40078]TXK19051.1 peptidoglycan DD-metalloendopeptidase family protein [Homoserinibacter sp. GY 40078]
MRTGARSRRPIAAVVAAIASGVLIATLGTTPSFAAPTDFPSWSDVQKAKKNEKAAKAQLKSIRASITSAQAEVDRTQKIAEQRGTEYAEAQQKYDEQVIVTGNIVEQQKAAQKQADKAKRESAQLIAGLAKQGGTDLTSGLFGDSGAADGYLYRIGAMQKVTERSDAVYAQAAQLQNTAQSLAEQAQVAQDKLDELKKDAEKKMLVAQQASEEAATRYEELQAAKAKAEALVAYLTDKREVTEADYLKGIREKWGSGAGGEVSSQGWARPASGYISSNYGMRSNPVTGVWMLHTGVDLAGQGCGAPIYAAHAGTVTYAGWFGTWGYYVKIDHGDGYDTGYAHIQPGGIGVHVGQEVGPGQLIAKVGTTGMSTGCHLHFITRINGNTTDPVPFMRQRGITLG